MSLMIITLSLVMFIHGLAYNMRESLVILAFMLLMAGGLTCL